MKITNIITKQNIFLELEVSSKKLLFKEISIIISKKENIKTNQILESLNEREKLGSTAIGNGIAIPHTKINGLKKIFSLFIKLNKPIDFSANDSKRVDLVFVIIAPEDSTTDHLLALSEISKFLKITKNVEKLRKSKSIEKIYKLLQEFNED